MRILPKQQPWDHENILEYFQTALHFLLPCQVIECFPLYVERLNAHYLVKDFFHMEHPWEKGNMEK